MTATTGNGSSGRDLSIFIQRKQDADGRKRMSCNGCRVLRKGCSDTCILRPCLQWIESPEAQGHATVFVAKFFGRAGLMAFISAVPDHQRPALFQSLLYEACGRTVNPVNGAVGLLWSGNWQLCQAAVETVLKGGTLRPLQSSSVIPTCSTRPSLMNSLSANLRVNSNVNNINSSNRLSLEVGKARPVNEMREMYTIKPELDFPLNQPQESCNPLYPWAAKVKSEPHDLSLCEAFEAVRHSQKIIHLPPSEMAAPPRRVRQRIEGINEANYQDLRNSNSDDVKSPRDFDFHPNITMETKANLDLTLNFELSSSSHFKRRVSSPSIVSVNSEGSVTSLESGSFRVPNEKDSSAGTEHKVLALFP